MVRNIRNMIADEDRCVNRKICANFIYDVIYLRRIWIVYSKRTKQLRFELAQTGNYSVSDDMLNELI